MNMTIKTLSALATCTAVAAGSAHAAPISIDFDSGGGVQSGDPTHGVGMSFTGQVGDWFTLNMGNGNTPDSPSIDTGSGILTINTTAKTYRVLKTASNVLREDFFWMNNATYGPIAWELTDLTPNASYDIILYGRYDPAYSGYRGGDMTVNGNLIAQEAGYTDEGGFHPEGDWNAAGVVADGDGKITGSFAFGSEAHAEWGGIQFQEVVPEPGSLALLGLGGLMIGRRRRA